MLVGMTTVTTAGAKVVVVVELVVAELLRHSLYRETLQVPGHVPLHVGQLRGGTRLIAEPNGKKRGQVNGQPCGEKLTGLPKLFEGGNSRIFCSCSLLEPCLLLDRRKKAMTAVSVAETEREWVSRANEQRVPLLLLLLLSRLA